MKTIIYLYRSRNFADFAMEKWQEDDYCLIRLGIPSLLWQNLRQLERENEQVWNCLEELKDWQVALLLLSDNPYWTTCAYEEDLRDKVNSDVWYRCWKIPEFDGYRESMWVEKLMPYASWDRYLILGYDSCIPNLLRSRAKEIRGVRWFLKEGRYPKGLQNFIEEFYEEFGLAIEIEILEKSEAWNRIHLASSRPVNILDFSGEERISAWEVAKDSVWLDLDSMDGKCKRIETRNEGVSYFSLKKLWKQRQKEPINLDTINKNRYNT